MSSIHLFIWRHAEAEDGSPDLARPLTAKGKRDAARVAKALAGHLDRRPRIIVGPATRTRETVQPLLDAIDAEPEIDDRLAPGAHLDGIVAAVDAAVDAPETRSIVLVGHQPWVGQVARRLLTGDDGDWAVKKAAAWWLVRRERDGTEWTLRSVLDPDLV